MAYDWSKNKTDFMTKVAILPEPTSQGDTLYRAVAGTHQAVAKTAGAALDALTAKLPPEESGTLVVVQNHRADRFFTGAQQQRLEELMRRWRTERDSGRSLTAAEQAELEDLIEAEVRASGERAKAALAGLER
jgi:hypothetical protein